MSATATRWLLAAAMLVFSGLLLHAAWVTGEWRGAAISLVQLLVVGGVSVRVLAVADR